MKNILLAVIALIIFPASLTSQNEKLWELELDEFVQLLDAEFFTDTSYITLEVIDSAEGKGEYNWYLKTRNLFTNEEIDSINVRNYYNYGIDVSIEASLFFICSGNRAYRYNYNLEIKDSFELDYFGASFSEISYFSVDWENQNIAAIHDHTPSQSPIFDYGLSVYNYKNKTLIDSITSDIPIYKYFRLNHLKHSFDNNYLATVFNDSAYHIKLFPSTDFSKEYTFEIPTWNEIKDYSFSPNNNYLIFTADTNVVYTADLNSKEIINRDSINNQFSEVFACGFLSDKYILIAGIDKNDKSTGIVYSFPEFKIVHKYQSRFGYDEINYDPDSKLILSNTDSLITLTRFDPKALKVESNKVHNSSTVYPNPVTDNANININISSPGEYNYTIVDISGRIVKEFKKQYFGEGEHNLEIDMSNIQQGVYFLNFSPKIGKTIKIIKDK